MPNEGDEARGSDFDGKVARIRRQLSSAYDEVDFIYNYSKKAGDPATATSAIKSNVKGMSSMLDTFYKSYESSYVELGRHYDDAGRGAEFPSDSDKKERQRVRSNYYTASGQIETLKTEEAGKIRTDAPNVTYTESKPTKTLPRLNLPTFDGQLVNWGKFRDSFVSMVHNESLPTIDKFQYLRASLKGPALTTIASFKIDEANYNLAWQAVLDAYDNKRMLANAYLEQLLNFKPLQTKGTPESLSIFLSSVCDNITAFKALDIREEGQFVLFYLAARCLDNHTRELFETGQKRDVFPTFDALTRFVRDRILSLQLSSNSSPLAETPHPISHKQQRNVRPPFPKEPPKMAFLTNKPGNYRSAPNPKAKVGGTTTSKIFSTNTPICTLCTNGHHSVSMCPIYVDATPLQRQTLLKGWEGCLNCLSPKHKVRDCPSKWSCRFCSDRHHSSLHSYQPISKANSSIEVSPISTNLSASVHPQAQIILGTAIAHVYDARGETQTIRIVLDSGSQNSFITHKCLNRLGLKMSKTNRMISGIGQTLFDGAKGKTLCTIKPTRNNGELLTTEAIVVPSITSYLPAVTLPLAVVQKCQGYTLADPSFWKPGPVDFLLGADLFTKIWTGVVKETGADGPDLISSIFGFVVMGRTSTSTASSSTSLLVVNGMDNLNFQLERFWELEQPTRAPTPANPEDLECEEHFKQTHYRLPSGRYGVRLPFRSEEPHLGDSSPAVLRRFYTLEKRLSNDLSVKQKYHDFMLEYLKLNHMSLATSTAKYHIPHHCITRESPDGLKLKAVFDCSAKAPNGSLNDHLLKGQKLQNDVRSIILRFRHHRYAFSTDIVKMFRMIEIHPADRRYLQIYWRFEADQPILRYELNTVSYGLICAPYQAQRVLKQLAHDNGHDFPLAQEALLKESYVDDFLTGASTLAEASALRDQLIRLLQLGGFELGKWSSNSPDLIGNFINQCSTSPVDLSSQEEQWVKVLGLQWDWQSDSFSFSLGAPNSNYSKRGVLSTLARLYDPLGFLTPVTFLMKTFVQDLWISKVDWDQEMPPTLMEPWKILTTELSKLSHLRIPRCVMPVEIPESCQIIGFADASSRGYAALIYLRITTSLHSHTSLITAKSRLAPTNTQSIPRLELSGALLLAELYAAMVADIYPANVSVQTPVFFTDSTITLAWINTPAHRLKVFVANRVAKIQELTAVSSWNHIASGENPADIGSRGVLPSQLLDLKLWWYGPPWLSLPVSQWPLSNPSYPSNLPDMKALECNVLVSSTPSDHVLQWISRFSSYLKLRKAAAWLLRWIHNLRQSKKSSSPRGGPLTQAEVKEGLMLCVRVTQSHYFPGQDIVQERFGNLRPFLDDQGIWCVGGRLSHSSLPESQKHPILLPHQAHLSALIVDHFHRSYLHPGPTTLQAIVQRDFWIPSLRRLIRLRGFRCQRCYKSRASPITPLMGNLPHYRVRGGRTFQHTGIDFAGPFSLKESSRRNASLGKVYLCLYICMATKALHLEAVTRLTTEAFLASFTRFTARRGIPSDVYTDNGTNFVGADNYLKELYRWFTSNDTKQAILDYAIDTRIQWHFNPPQTPHMGGLWEAGVKSVKRHLRLIGSDAHLTYEEIATWFSKIEAMLNSRPLCPLSTDPNENDYLSPGHFLVGGPLIAAPEPSLLDVKEHLLTRWQRVSRMSEEFWKRWSSEYLGTLQRRPKWIKSKPNLEVGDLVLIKESSLPLQWKTGRITAVHPGKDGTVRVVTLKQGNSNLRRHVTNLVPLPHLTEPSFPQAYQQ